MVTGIERVRAKFAAVVPAVVNAARAEMETVAGQIVSQMRMINPLPGTIVIEWTWGATPRGAVTLGRVAKSADARMRITIFATATTSEYPQGFPAVVRWFEFGTAERVRANGGSTGRIVAQPFFFPTYRANRRRVRTRISRAVNKAVKDLNA